MSTALTRRRFLQASAASAAATSCAHVRRSGAARGPVAVSSQNGLRSVEIAVGRMAAGVPPVDAAVIGIEPVENDPNDTSVGYGGLPNEEGVVELDSCVMDGPSGLGGAVAALRNIKNPSQVALKVMRHTDHVLLVGDGALRFARAHGFVEENLLTERSRREWLRWKARMSGTDDWLDPDENGAFGKEWVERRPTGTIHVGCIDAAGDLGGCTSTSGLAFKIPGRVGDSPLLGCGNYVDNDFGVAGSTGRGEAVILVNGAARAVRYMAEGSSPTDACLAVCRDIVRMTRSPRLLRPDGKPDFQVNFYAIDKAGRTGGASLYPSRYARMAGHGPEVVDSAALFE
jgi:N4-(beta-N-acetylglucosaminyl)-L-asparaginase